MMEKDAFLFTGRIAENYDKYLGPILFEPYGVEMARRANVTSVRACVLELACGTGRVTKHLRDCFKEPVKLTATDLSADMLQLAESKLGDLGIEFRVEDAQNLSFAEDTFDLIVCQFGFMFLPDKKKGLSEMLRVLKPGGRLMLSTWESTENIPLLQWVFNGCILEAFKTEEEGRLLVPFSLHNQAQLEEWFQETGFKNIESVRVVLQSGAATPDEIADAFFRKHSIGQQVLAANPAAFEQTAQKIITGIKERFAHDKTFGLAAFFVSGEK